MMKIGRLERDGKWNWGMSFGQDPMTWNRLAKVFRLWCFRFRDGMVPMEAAAVDLTQASIKGFFFEKKLFTDLMVVLHTKSFRIPYWIQIYREK